MTRDNNPETVTELDRLDAAVKAAPAGDTAAQIALWRQVTRLEHWFFIARGSADRPVPYAVAAEQGSMICLFSSAARAGDATHTLGLVDSESGAAPLFSVPVPAAIDYVASFAQAGVFGVTLDHPRLGHYIPLANLGLLKGWVDGAAQ
ncbi:hypothetical protein ABZ816_15765 [Actinosynnema sp. NPDC047251]|uniref:SseB protein N-terminal domain-containing protein n=1 Tax=Saccharothrix espanaensis (strain ATCC 51144 / DSM 44229 / JCM 9112 / NBRC 15066 / NRRL 15764) TaxID=1179773 RepID=K0JVM4_SACES|nr:hypothetical protein [Saccharothrix espanaensis]CCH29522.1 hypothetical protein BN6_22000 [Saccharothrix espanaensis DSM 44229]